jgi:hypothetical protein
MKASGSSPTTTACELLHGLATARLTGHPKSNELQRHMHNVVNFWEVPCEVPLNRERASKGADTKRSQNLTHNPSSRKQHNRGAEQVRYFVASGQVPHLFSWKVSALKQRTMLSLLEVSSSSEPAGSTLTASNPVKFCCGQEQGNGRLSSREKTQSTHCLLEMLEIGRGRKEVRCNGQLLGKLGRLT